MLLEQFMTVLAIVACIVGITLLVLLGLIIWFFITALWEIIWW